MSPEQDLENQDDLTSDDNTQTTDTSSTQQSQKSANATDSVNWEARYKGLQKVVGKKDGEIETLQQQLDSLATELEEMRTQSGSLEVDKNALSRKLEEIQTQFNQATSEREKLKAQLDQQELILSEFPDIAPLAKFIPQGEDLNQFKTNAADFKTALDTLVEQRVKNVMEGSTPPLPRDKGGEMVTEDATDKLWQKVYALAGVPGKEQEYEEARAQLVNIMEASNKQ